MKLERRQNQMEASLARERQESARSNIVNARLEQRVAELEQMMQSQETNENTTLNTKRSTKPKAK